MNLINLAAISLLEPVTVKYWHTAAETVIVHCKGCVADNNQQCWLCCCYCRQLHLPVHLLVSIEDIGVTLAYVQNPLWQWDFASVANIATSSME